MKKVCLILLFLMIFIVTLTGCTSSSGGSSDASTLSQSDTSEYVLIGYPPSSYLAMIEDKQIISRLTDLFNNTEYIKSDMKPEGLWMEVLFHKKNAVKTFYIYKNDVIKQTDGNIVKSKDISFKKIYDLFEKYHNKKFTLLFSEILSS